MAASIKAISRLLSSDDSLVYRVGLHNIHTILKSRTKVDADTKAAIIGILWEQLRMGNNDIARACAMELGGLVRAGLLEPGPTLNQLQSTMTNIPTRNVTIVACAVANIVLDSLFDKASRASSSDSCDHLYDSNTLHTTYIQGTRRTVKGGVNEAPQPLVKLLVSFASVWPDVVCTIEQRLIVTATKPRQSVSTSKSYTVNGAQHGEILTTTVLEGLRPFFLHTLLQPYGIEPGLRSSVLTLLTRLYSIHNTNSYPDTDTAMSEAEARRDSVGDWCSDLLLEVVVTMSLEDSECIGWINLVMSLMIPSLTRSTTQGASRQTMQWFDLCLSLCTELQRVGRDGTPILAHLQALLNAAIRTSAAIDCSTIVGMGYLLLTCTSSDLPVMLDLTQQLYKYTEERDSNTSTNNVHDSSIHSDAHNEPVTDNASAGVGECGRGISAQESWGDSFLLCACVLLVNNPVEEVAYIAGDLLSRIMARRVTLGVVPPSVSTDCCGSGLKHMDRQTQSKLCSCLQFCSDSGQGITGHAFYKTLIAAAQMTARCSGRMSHLASPVAGTENSSNSEASASKRMHDSYFPPVVGKSAARRSGLGVDADSGEKKGTENVPFYKFYALCPSLFSANVGTREMTIEAMCVLVQFDSRYALWALALFMFRLRNETQPYIKLRLLYRLPVLGTDKKKFAAVVQVLNTLVSKSSALGQFTKLRLSCEMWKCQPRAYTEFKESMLKYKEHLTHLTRRQKEPVSEEHWVVWSLTIRDVCKWKGGQYGEEMLPLALDVVRTSTHEACVILGLQALRQLCIEDIVSVRAVLKVLSNTSRQSELGLATAHLACINNETRPQVLAGYLDLLRSIPPTIEKQDYEDTPSGLEGRACQEEFRYRVIQLLWTAATLHRDWRVRKSACEGLLHFPLIDMVKDYDALVDDLIQRQRMTVAKKIDVSNPLPSGEVSASTHIPIPVSGDTYAALLLRTEIDQTEVRDGEAAGAVVKRALEYELTFAQVRKGLDYKTKRRGRGPVTRSSVSDRTAAAGTDASSRVARYIVQFLSRSHQSSATPRTRTAASFGLIQCGLDSERTAVNAGSGMPTTHEHRRNMLKSNMIEWSGLIKYRGAPVSTVGNGCDWPFHLHLSASWGRFMARYLYATCQAIVEERRRDSKEKMQPQESDEEEESIELEAFRQIAEELAAVSRTSGTSRVNCTIALGALVACVKQNSRELYAYVDRVVASFLCMLDLELDGATDIEERNRTIAGPELSWIVTSGGVNDVSPYRRVAAILGLCAIGPRLRSSSHAISSTELSLRLVDVLENRADLLDLDAGIGYAIAAGLGSMMAELPTSAEHARLIRDTTRSLVRAVQADGTSPSVRLGAYIGMSIGVIALRQATEDLASGKADSRR
ncbi:hypothetical protein SARC_04346 [Sphaeroforma arctica JP610]|uniref:DUF3730 domain-containing protein n=1 Tax=Sphaeroforma arctica JP610 TaxID=667725 RepID=A0A0L0G2V0_9EUKA|nr:hypothetical protein SARC_04346 [Sphaeroforma arctica JP610]KNC83405.1 hypothetical protein SARC_04346 [Sphaeroforma arctica JP610]|eukprot:XP_014157307.1 hypothetical protein SARC_04346 [Sphaeroforma arctica JP610]